MQNIRPRCTFEFSHHHFQGQQCPVGTSNMQRLQDQIRFTPAFKIKLEGKPFITHFFPASQAGERRVDLNRKAKGEIRTLVYPWPPRSSHHETARNEQDHQDVRNTQQGNGVGWGNLSTKTRFPLLVTVHHHYTNITVPRADLQLIQ